MRLYRSFQQDLGCRADLLGEVAVRRACRGRRSGRGRGARRLKVLAVDRTRRNVSLCSTTTCPRSSPRPASVRSTPLDGTWLAWTSSGTGLVVASRCGGFVASWCVHVLARGEVFLCHARGLDSDDPVVELSRGTDCLAHPLEAGRRGDGSRRGLSSPPIRLSWRRRWTRPPTDRPQGCRRAQARGCSWSTCEAVGLVGRPSSQDDRVT
jgi:hypothetical protein